MINGEKIDAMYYADGGSSNSTVQPVVDIRLVNKKNTSDYDVLGRYSCGYGVTGNVNTDAVMPAEEVNFIESIWSIFGDELYFDAPFRVKRKHNVRKQKPKKFTLMLIIQMFH